MFFLLAFTKFKGNWVFANNEREIILLSQAKKIYSNISFDAFHALEFIGPSISAVFLGRQCALMFLRPPNTITIYLQYKNSEQMSCAKDALFWNMNIFKMISFLFVEASSSPAGGHGSVPHWLQVYFSSLIFWYRSDLTNGFLCSKLAICLNRLAILTQYCCSWFDV